MSFKALEDITYQGEVILEKGDIFEECFIEQLDRNWMAKLIKQGFAKEYRQRARRKSRSAPQSIEPKE